MDFIIRVINIITLKFWIIYEHVRNFWGNHVVSDFPDYYHEECFMCNNSSCDDCHKLVVLIEGGYLWNKYGDIVGTYSDGYGTDTKNIGLNI